MSVNKCKKIVAVIMTATFLLGSLVFTCECLEAEEIVDNQQVEVSELDLGDYVETMKVGEKQLLVVSVLPSEADNKKIEYSSSNQEVAIINGMGRISALKSGETVITAQCAGVSGSFTLKVEEGENVEDKTEVSDIEISDYEDELKVGETMKLTATVLPSSARESAIVYKSSDESVATVNSQGEVKGINKGNVTITISAGKIVREVKLNIIVATKSIKLSDDYVVLKPGESKQVSASALPSDAPQNISFKTDDQEVATVSEDGVITARSTGNTVIIVSNKEMTAAITVIVNTASKNASSYEKEIKEFDEVKNNEVVYSDIILASECEVVTEEVLKYLYENQKDLLVQGDGYTVLIYGSKIVNYKNELSTKLNMKKKKGGSTEFIVNNGNKLCGEIVIGINNVSGKYLYLYNTSKKQYEKIEMSSPNNIKVTRAGKYMISNEKMGQDTTFLSTVVIIGTIILVTLLSLYVFVKKRYWFW